MHIWSEGKGKKPEYETALSKAENAANYAVISEQIFSFYLHIWNSVL